MKIKNREFIKELGISNDLKVNKSTYNHSKLLEECCELNEVLIKMINKSAQRQPPQSKLIEELGDVIFRCAVLMVKEDIEEQVEARVEAKIAQLQGYLTEGKYKGGV